MELAERRMVERFLAVGDSDEAERRMAERFLVAGDPDRSALTHAVAAAVASVAVASLAPPPPAVGPVEDVAPIRRPMPPFPCVSRPLSRPRVPPPPSKPVPAPPPPARTAKRAPKRPASAASLSPRESIFADELPLHVQAEVDRIRREEMYAVLDLEDTPMHDLEARYECPLCMENALRVRIGPCGHCTCAACAKRAWGTNGKCSMCNATIDSMMAIFVG